MRRSLSRVVATRAKESVKVAELIHEREYRTIFFRKSSPAKFKSDLPFSLVVLVPLLVLVRVVHVTCGLNWSDLVVNTSDKSRGRALVQI